MAYRGDGEASPERLAQLDEEIATLEARFEEVFWERVAPVWGVRRELDPQLTPLESRHDRVAALEDAIQRAKTGRAAQPHLPPPREPSQGLLGEWGRMLSAGPGRLAEEVLGPAREHDTNAELTPRAGGHWGVRLSLVGAPIDLALMRVQSGDNIVYMVRGETTVAPSARLSLRPEGILQDLLEMVGLSKEIEVGDRRFDPLFIIKGSPATADLFLTKNIRKRLLTASEAATPLITLTGGKAQIERLSPSKRVTTQIVEVLARWHRLPSPHTLLTPP